MKREIRLNSIEWERTKRERERRKEKKAEHSIKTKETNRTYANKALRNKFHEQSIVSDTSTFLFHSLNRKSYINRIRIRIWISDIFDYFHKSLILLLCKWNSSHTRIHINNGLQKAYRRDNGKMNTLPNKQTRQEREEKCERNTVSVLLLFTFNAPIVHFAKQQQACRAWHGMA